MTAPYTAGNTAPDKAEKARKRRKMWIWVSIITVLISVLFIVATYAFIDSVFNGDKFLPTGDSVGLIHVSGVIAEEDIPGIGLAQGVTTSPIPFIRQMEQAEEEPMIKAILIRVNSPGGTPAAAQEMYRAVKQAKKPVVISIADIGASGAYYVSSGADKIYADPASAVGSIGVIQEIPDYSELMKKLGIKTVTITQGKYKDLGNPARPMTEEEKQLLNDQANIIYEQFISDVVDGRKMKKDKVRKLATGITYPGTEAKKLGLIDEVGGYSEALIAAAKLGKIKGKPEVVPMATASFFDIFGGFGGYPGIKDLLLREILGNALGAGPGRMDQLPSAEPVLTN